MDIGAMPHSLDVSNTEHAPLRNEYELGVIPAVQLHNARHPVSHNTHNTQGTVFMKRSHTARLDSLALTSS